MAEVELVGIRKRFRETRAAKPAMTDLLVAPVGVARALDGLRSVSRATGDSGPFALDVDLTIPEGRTMVILGPSGCGKTTLLKIVAGLEEPDSGTIRYDGRDMAGVRPGERRIGMVFQDYALFPHLDAQRNILSHFMFRKKTPELAEEARHRFERTSELLGVEIEHLLHRKPARLSGGEKQRVAVGRCITRDPALFLLDEPFANLDAQLRERYRLNLRRLLQEFGVTTVYVTHDQQEALVLADSIAVMDHGSIVQVGRYRDLYLEPVDLFVASFFNPDPATPALNVLDGTALAPSLAGKLAGIRPEDVAIGAGGYEVDAVLLEARPIPAQPAWTAIFTVGGVEFHARLPAEPLVGAGSEVGLRLGRVHLFDAASGLRLETVS